MHYDLHLTGMLNWSPHSALLQDLSLFGEVSLNRSTDHLGSAILQVMYANFITNEKH